MDSITKQEVEAMFLLVRLPALKIWRLPNQYFTYQEGEDEETTRKEAVYRESRPSWLIKTKGGLIQIDLRKRVAELDWSDTQLDIKPGPNDDVTKGMFSIHTWTKLKLVEYLADVADAIRADLAQKERLA